MQFSTYVGVLYTRGGRAPQRMNKYSSIRGPRVLGLLPAEASTKEPGLPCTLAHEPPKDNPACTHKRRYHADIPPGTKSREEEARQIFATFIPDAKQARMLVTARQSTCPMIKLGTTCAACQRPLPLPCAPHLCSMEH